MKTTTIELPDETEAYLKQMAHMTGRSEADLIREAIEDYLTRTKRPLHPCIGMGASGQPDLAQRDEELLWSEGMAILADTSSILALLDRDEQYHQATVEIVKNEIIWVPATVLPEVDYLATKHLGEQVARAFLAALVENYFTYLPVEPNDLARSLQIMTRYRDAPLGLVDSSIVALAERYRIQRILTLDRRHFTLVRPEGIDYLELLP